MNARNSILAVLILLIFAGTFLYFVLGSLNLETVTPKSLVFLTASDLQLAAVEGVKAGLRELGYQDGVNTAYEIRNPKGDRDLMRKMAEDIVAAHPDLIVSVSTSASRAVIDANKAAKLPVVAVDVGNFMELGIENIQRPGGFITGVVVNNVPVAPKRMEILRTLNPDLKTIGILVNNKHVSYDEILLAHEEGAKKLGVKLRWYEVTQKDEILPALERLIKDRPDAFMTTSEAVISGNADLIASVLSKNKIPSIDFNIERGVSSGYLMVYGIPRFETGFQSARIIDKVLRGKDPGEIPVEFASAIRFEINDALAREMGIKIPESLFLRANKIYSESIQ